MDLPNLTCTRRVWNTILSHVIALVVAMICIVNLISKLLLFYLWELKDNHHVLYMYVCV